MAFIAISALVLAACSSNTDGSGSTASPTAASNPSTASTTPSSRTSSPTVTRVPVHVSVNISDGAEVGVGLPYIAHFDRKITDGRAFAKATTVTVNGQPAHAAWYFEYSDPANGYVMEAHLRLQNFWPAHAHVHIDLPVQGLSGGAVPHAANSQYAFSDSLTSEFTTGDARIVTVSNATHTLTVVDDGKVWGTFPVSLGAPNTPTKRGVKVIMEQLTTVCMHDVNNTYHECGIKWDSRLTYDGEYLHAAPWNCIDAPGCTGPGNNIGRGNSSNGCTNLRPGDAQKLYDFLKVGDPVLYPDADGPRMQLGGGFGDWNVTWGLWQTGGVIPTQ